MSTRRVQAVAVRDLSVELGGVPVVDHVRFDVEAGSWVCLIGPNGAGKTTVLRALAGLVDASGAIELWGRPLAEMRRSERVRRVAYVPQSPVVPDGISVLEYVLLGRTPHIPRFGWESHADLDAAHDALERLDLAGHAGRNLNTLSGGEQQRAVLARAFAQDASLLLLDEPTTALDIGHQQEVLDIIDELRVVHGLTVLSTMHDLAAVGEYAERLCLLHDGGVVAAGRPDEVLTEVNLERFYRARVRIVRDGAGPIVLPVRTTTRHG